MATTALSFETPREQVSVDSRKPMSSQKEGQLATGGIVHTIVDWTLWPSSRNARIQRVLAVIAAATAGFFVFQGAITLLPAGIPSGLGAAVCAYPLVNIVLHPLFSDSRVSEQIESTSNSSEDAVEEIVDEEQSNSSQVVQSVSLARPNQEENQIVNEEQSKSPQVVRAVSFARANQGGNQSDTHVAVLISRDLLKKHQAPLLKQLSIHNVSDEMVENQYQAWLGVNGGKIKADIRKELEAERENELGHVLEQVSQVREPAASSVPNQKQNGQS